MLQSVARLAFDCQVDDLNCRILYASPKGWTLVPYYHGFSQSELVGFIVPIIVDKTIHKKIVNNCRDKKSLVFSPKPWNRLKKYCDNIGRQPCAESYAPYNYHIRQPCIISVKTDKYHFGIFCVFAFLDYICLHFWGDRYVLAECFWQNNLWRVSLESRACILATGREEGHVWRLTFKVNREVYWRGTEMKKH